MKALSSFVFAAVLLGLLQPSMAGLSAKRAPDEDFRTFLQPQVSIDSSLTEEDVVEWSSLEQLKFFFESSRDKRELVDSHKFQRRISWLYPDDGCFARAALVTQQAQALNLPLPNRVFLFGDLAVATPNSPDHEVTWWYHTAPVVKVKGVLYVLDASIDPNKPMVLKDWVAKQTSENDAHELKICRPFTYDPSAPCNNATQDPSARAQREIQGFLRAEWRRQVELDRDPFKVLGDEPPWKNHRMY